MHQEQKRNGKDIFIRILLPTVITFVLFVISIFWIVLPFIENSMMEQKRLMLKELVEIVYSDLVLFHNMEKKGECTKEEAQHKALEQIKRWRYGPEGKDYFWVNDMHPNMLMHPYRSDLNGKDISGFADPAGKHLFVEFVKVVRKKGAGYVDYMWQWKDDPDHIVPKISYVKRFEPWGWVIGTGIYIQDVKIEIEKTKYHLEQISFFILLLIGLLCLYIIWQAHKIERQRAEARLAVYRSEQRNRILVENAPEGIMVIHPGSGRIVDVNPNTEILFGLDKEELLSKTPWEISPHIQPDGSNSKSQILDHIKHAFDGEFKLFEWSFEHQQTAKQIICELRMVKLPYLGSDHIRCTILDISVRKMAEQEVEYLKQYLSDIIDSMPSILISVDKNLMIKEFNRRSQIATDYDSKNITGRPVDEIFSNLRPVIEQIKNAVDNDEPVIIEKLERIVDGQHIFETVTIYPLQSKLTDGAVIRIDDVTARVKFEEDIIQNEKMLSVGGLAAGMAHEINNPLAGIILSAGVLQQRLLVANENNKKVAQSLGLDMDKMNLFMNERKIESLIQNIIESGERAAAIIQNMLSFARKTDSELSPHNIADLMNKSIALMTAHSTSDEQIQFADVKIIKEYEEMLPDVMCEPGKIQQVFFNILRNAVDAMNSRNDHINGWSPLLSIRVNHVASSNTVHIEIEDNGQGISPTESKQIFEPFFTTRPPGKGTGLGLSVSYFIITENHKGTMNVISNQGEGTTFIIDLPVNS